MSRERRVVHFSGTVQGVGFRATTVRIAERHPVAGHVKNLPDGRVRCEIEGAPSEIDAFLDDITQALAGHIAETDQRRVPTTGAGGGFHIAR
ncbi:MAG: acylphosphatase [Planctomycetota bacterium]